MQKTSYSGGKRFIYANATILEAILSSVKQYYWWKFMGYKTIPAGSLVTNTQQQTEVKKKELRYGA
jgi:hypothetical protein